MSLRSLVLGLAVLASFSLPGCGPEESADLPPAIQWSATPGQAGLSATFFVPLNPLAGEGPSVSLALRRFPASGVKQGTILFNPGGPGASAIDYLDYFVDTGLGVRLRANFDLVAFDPRGVGYSSPVRCVDNPVPYVAIDKNPQTVFEYDSMVSIMQAYQSECAGHGGPLLGHLSTLDVVQDMELIRQALGEGPLNYVGFSYGSKLGALYANVYPGNVRAMVLDGVYPPSLSLLDFTYGQVVGFEQSLTAFLAACEQDATCQFGGNDPELALLTLLANLKQQPVPAAGDEVLTYGLAQYGIMLGLYDQLYWPWLDDALMAAQTGDGGPLLYLAQSYFMRNSDGSYPNAIDMLFAVSCTDFAPLDAAEIQAQLPGIRTTYPFFGAMGMLDNLYCTGWPVSPKTYDGPFSASGAPQIMVVGTTGDPATPYAWAQRLVTELDSSFLVTYKAEQHVAGGSSPCVDARYEQYLLAPQTGFANLTCGPETDGSAKMSAPMRGGRKPLGPLPAR